MRRRPVTQWTLAGIAGLTLAWVLAPAAVPIYDGPGFADEPYRYVHPPAGAKATPPPTTAKRTLAVNAQGFSAAGYSNSSEQGPQIVLYVPSGALQAPVGAKSIEVSETPVAPAAPLPSDGSIVGNVYRVAASSTGPVQVVGKDAAHQPTLQMRAPSAQQPGPVFEHRAGNRWQQYPTIRVGQDIYQATAPAFGDWALVRVASKSSSSGGVNVGLLAGGIAVLVIAGIIIAIRLTRSRRQA